MRIPFVIAMAISLSACVVEQVGPPGVVLTRPLRVRAQDVRVFQTLAEIKGRFSVVDTVHIKDDGEDLPHVLEGRLRELAGSRGANAIIADPLNRKLNGTRVDFKPTFDQPFEYFSGTAIWIGDGAPPQKYLGALGGRDR